jgi:hypothetical protein
MMMIKSAYDDRIYSKSLLGVTTTCPECGDILRATGYLSHFDQPGISTWGIEYECPNEGIVFTIHEVTKQAVIDEALRDAGKQL